MAKRQVIWVKNAEIQMLDVMDYYFFRNKSKDYSLKLHKAIKLKLHSLDFIVALPQKTSIDGLFYFTHKHITVLFSLENTNIIVKMIWDERRSNKLLQNIFTELK